MKLLIAEDNSRMRNMIADMFAPYFEKIYECENGLEAVEQYTAYKPDWVFMDIKMPGKDGITATREITDLFYEAKIIIVTDYDDKELRLKAMSSGARHYILKEDISTLESIILKNSIN